MRKLSKLGNKSRSAMTEESDKRVFSLAEEMDKAGRAERIRERLQERSELLTAIRNAGRLPLWYDVVAILVGIAALKHLFT
jgi:hypothetical protein